MMISGDYGEAMHAVRSHITRHIDLVMFLALPLFALFLRGYYWRAGRNYADVATFALFVVGQSFLYATLLAPISKLAPEAASSLRVLVQVALFTWAAKVFFLSTGARGWLKALGVQVLYALSIVPFAGALVIYTIARGVS